MPFLSSDFFFAWEHTLVLFALDIGHHAAPWMYVGKVVCSLFFLGREWRWAPCCAS